jgi:hypothetical protein
MPKVKKAKATKATKKVAPKRTTVVKAKAKPAAKAKSKPTAKAKTKTTKGKAVDATLQQTFMSSLASLETFWDKKAQGLKKQLATLQAKLDKANKKKTPKKGTQIKIPAAVVSLQNNVQQTKEELSAAKNAFNKYTALSKMIRQFEKDWSKGLEPVAAKPEKNDAKPQSIIDRQTKHNLANLYAGSDFNTEEPEELTFDEDIIKDADYETIEEMFAPIDDADSLELMEENPDNYGDEDGYEEY